MIPNQQKIDDAQKVYELYWDSYLRGDITAFGTTLHDKYELIGTSENEICRNKVEGIEYCRNQLSEVKDKVKRENRLIKVSPIDDHILISEFLDMYIKPEKEWTFYSKLRISSLLVETSSGWKIVQQHGSIPDTRIQGDETLAFDKISKENLELRDAVKRSTAELEHKNRELQIEAALERVRSRTMAMNSSEELAETASVLFQEIRKLGIETYSSGFNIWDEDNDSIVSWMSNPSGELNPPFELPISGYDQHERIFEAWKNGKSFLEDDLKGGRWDKHMRFLKSFPSLADAFTKSENAGVPTPDRQVHNIVFFSQGYLLFITLEPMPLAKKLFERFGKVFEQTYTRFLDLKKAEAQAREARIEMALERVRSRSMAMQKSDELNDVAFVLFEQLRNLGGEMWGTGFVFCEKDKDEDVAWFAVETGILPPVSIPNTDDPTHAQMYAGWKDKKDFVSITKSGKELEDHYEYMLSLPKVRPFFQQILDSGLRFPKKQQWNAAYYKHGYLLLITTEEYSDPDILKRFAKVFEQSYTRFEDLQKAEAQAREAKIEMALERVRARTMAMQHSDELTEASQVLDEQVHALGIQTWGSAFHIYAEDAEGDYEWFSSREGTLPFYKTPRENFFLKFYEKGKAGETFHVEEFIGEDCKDHYDYLMTLPVIGDALREIVASGGSLPESQYDHIAFFKYGFVLFITYEPVPEAHDIFKRFAKVFEQTYTRFLDLQKAEAQAREAKIEAGLEKIRSRTMGMQNSEELPEVANLLFLEIQALGIHAWSCGYCILEEDGHSSSCIMSSEGTVQKPFLLPHRGEASFEEWDDFVHSENSFFVQELEGEAIESHYGFMKSLPQLTPIFQDLQDEGLSLPTYQVNHLCKFSNGFLLFITYEKVPKAHDIFKRFTSVFDQTYTRFLDLKKSEQRAREAEIELALERIRSKVSAMQESSDLLDIVVNMRSEFISLGHEAHYFWYMRWLEDKYEKAMTSGDGSKIGMIMTLPRKIHAEIESVVRWELSDEPYMVLDMAPDMAVDYVNKMITLGDFEQVDPQAPSLDDVRDIGGLTFIMARTRQGEIGYSLPGVVPDPPKNAIETLVRFAGVFDLAYQRFEDLKEAEQQAKLIREERDRLEATLKELHATQDQLIQQEKLASLGQLTAGIAHEIKNPLNFVNNFSDLSVELIEEARDEIRRWRDDREPEDDNTLILEIINDIEMNLKKIHEHGTRADGIVKSMLEHSRGGTGKMEPSDLNALVKEFTNLSFHGMRASKNPINVDIEFDLDDSINEIPLVAEDFSRVIVNLCNNSFDAMREKISEKANVISEKSPFEGGSERREQGDNSAPDYIPRLTIRTYKNDSTVTIEIKDNGPGIPVEIRPSVMQPFYTTKKGTQGTGLGLSITNDIVKAHGGSLTISDSNVNGTTFKIALGAF